MTGRHRGLKQKLRAGQRVPSLKRTSHVAMHFHRRVRYRALSLRYACIRSSDIILIPLGYICAKFRFFRSPYCWASPWRKIAYSITHSITHQLIWCPRNRSFRFRIMEFCYWKNPLDFVVDQNSPMAAIMNYAVMYCIRSTDPHLRICSEATDQCWP